MLILLGMLLIGLFAAAWGFTMCFLPAQWDRLTEAIGGPTPRWMFPGPKSLAPIMNSVTVRLAWSFVLEVVGLPISQ
jgi:hypothetical protein